MVLDKDAAMLLLLDRVGPVGEPGAWAATAPWEHKPRVVPGKLGDEPRETDEFDPGAPQQSSSENSYTPQKDTVDRDTVGAESSRPTGKVRQRMQKSGKGDISDLIERL